MRTAILLATGFNLLISAHIWAQNIESKRPDSIISAISAHTLVANNAQFKLNYKPHAYHYPQIGFVHSGIKGYKVLMPQKIGKTGLMAEKMQMHRHVRIMPLYSQAACILQPVENSLRQFDLCSCVQQGMRRNAPNNGKALQPAVVASKKISDTHDDDGGIDITLAGSTSLNVDLGFKKATDSTDMAMDMDDDGNDGLDISIGLEFGLGK